MATMLNQAPSDKNNVRRRIIKQFSDRIEKTPIIIQVNTGYARNKHGDKTIIRRYLKLVIRSDAAEQLKV